MRKIIVYIATSADGYIARPDGDVAWLDRPGLRGDYGIKEFFSCIDTILWGRKTYDFAAAHGGLQMYGPKVKNYIFSHRPPKPLPAERGVEWIAGSIKSFAQRLRAQRGKDIWMMGGAGLIASFLDENEIDEFSIHVIPILIGEGIPLIQPRRRSIPLKLLSTKRFKDGVVHLNYKVLPS